MAQADERATECTMTVSSLERAEQTATERARDATDTDPLLPKKAQQGQKKRRGNRYGRLSSARS